MNWEQGECIEIEGEKRKGGKWWNCVIISKNKKWFDLCVCCGLKWVSKYLLPLVQIFKMNWPDPFLHCAIQFASIHHTQTNCCWSLLLILFLSCFSLSSDKITGMPQCTNHYYFLFYLFYLPQKYQIVFSMSPSECLIITRLNWTQTLPSSYLDYSSPLRLVSPPGLS